MASRLVVDRQRAAESVTAVATAQGPELALALTSVFSRSGADIEAADLTRVMKGLSELLVRARDEMSEADALNEGQARPDTDASVARDLAMARLRDRLVELREILGGLYGPSVARSVMPRATPTDPVVMVRFAAAVVNNLSSQPLGESSIKGINVDVATMGTAIENDRALLERTLLGMTRESSEGEAALQRKNAAIAEFDRFYQGVASVMAGLCLLAGHDGLAEKIRPPVRSLLPPRPAGAASSGTAVGAARPRDT